MLVPVLLLTGVPATAADRLDHRGALGLLLGTGLELGELVQSGTFEEYARPEVSLGFSVPVGVEGNELKAWARAAKASEAVAWSFIAGYRGYFGSEQFKTFIDLDAAFDFGPKRAVGPRLGFGLQWEIGSTAGIFAGVAARAGVGSHIRFAAELFAGLQLRSYLLE
jgi:hypothetical protein